MSAARRSPALGPTVLACGAMLLAFCLLAAHGTDGFVHWTWESQRRAHAQAGRLQAPATLLQLADGSHRRVFGADARTALAPGATASAVPRIHLVDFIYTRCPTVCQVLGAEFHRAQELLRQHGRGDVGLLSISFDVEHDVPGRLRAYAGLHRADARAWSVAVPASAGESRSLLRQLGVVVLPDGFGGYTHNAAIHLVDAQGRVHAIYGQEDWQEALAHALRLAAAAEGDG